MTRSMQTRSATLKTHERSSKARSPTKTEPRTRRCGMLSFSLSTRMERCRKRQRSKREERLHFRTVVFSCQCTIRFNSCSEEELCKGCGVARWSSGAILRESFNPRTPSARPRAARPPGTPTSASFFKIK